jgi:hypothetical protein
MKNLLKTKLQICYSFVREQNRLLSIIEETEDYEHEKYLKSKVDEIERHLQKHFSSKTIRNCRDMHADYRNGDTYSRYEHGNWVAFQTNKKYGRNSDSWFAAKRVRDLLRGATIPF